MKIICIGRNYVAHAKELGNDVPDEPVIFIKPSTSLTVNNKPFFIPEFTNEVHYELELVIRICRNGRSIEPKFAHRYYDQIGIGIDYTARDLQAALKAKGLPWEKAKAFDDSAAISALQPFSSYSDKENITFRLEKNGKVVQDGNSNLMIFDFNRIIAEASKYFRLSVGDLIFTGTPAGVGKVEIGDRLVGYLESEPLIDVRIK